MGILYFTLREDMLNHTFPRARCLSLGLADVWFPGSQGDTWVGHYSESEHGVWNKSAPSRHSGFWQNAYDLKRTCTEDKYGQDGRAAKDSDKA